MNKEELKKEAQKSFDELDDWSVGDDWSIEESYVNGYSNGAEPREKQLQEKNKKIAELEKENKVLAQNLEDTEICEKTLKDKVAELKQFIKTQDRKLRQQLKVCDDAINRVEVLAKENAELKEVIDNNIDKKIYVQLAKKANLVDVQRFQLTTAKEIIKKFSEFVNNEIEYDLEHPQKHTDLWNKLCEEAEQFLSEVEK